MCSTQILRQSRSRYSKRTKPNRSRSRWRITKPAPGGSDSWKDFTLYFGPSFERERNECGHDAHRLDKRWHRLHGTRTDSRTGEARNGSDRARARKIHSEIASKLPVSDRRSA